MFCRRLVTSTPASPVTYTQPTLSPLLNDASVTVVLHRIGVPGSEDVCSGHGRKVGRGLPPDVHPSGVHPGGRLVGRRGEWVKHRKLNAHDALSMVDLKFSWDGGKLTLWAVSP